MNSLLTLFLRLFVQKLCLFNAFANKNVLNKMFMRVCATVVLFGCGKLQLLPSDVTLSCRFATCWPSWPAKGLEGS